MRKMRSQAVATHGAEPAPSERPTRAQWLTLLILCMALLIVIVDVTIVNVALPSIRKEFNASLRELEWITRVYRRV